VQRDYLEDYIAEGVTYVDVPFQVGASSLNIDATLDFNSTHIADIPGVGTLGIPDLDFMLYDPDGTEIGRSGNGGGPEHIAAAVTRPGTYVYRVYGWLNPLTDFTITSRQLLGAVPPVLLPFTGDFTGAAGATTDFDGNYVVNWQPTGQALNYEVEESVDGGSFSVVRTVSGTTTSVSFSKVPDGIRSYRIRSITSGRIGYFVTMPSNVESITIDRRCQVNITRTTQSAISNVSLLNGVFQLNLDLTNGAVTTYYPLLEMKVVRINSATGTVSVINSDNGGNGTSSNKAALFGYSNLLGVDEAFTSGEKTGARTLQFRDSASEMFTFDAVVTAYKRKGSGATGGTTASSPAAGEPDGSEPLVPDLTELVRFTVNPLTGKVTTQLLQ